MNKREYKYSRKDIMDEYDAGLLTPDELGGKLIHLTNSYRKTNNIEKSGKHNVFVHEDKYDVKGKLLKLVTKKEEYELLRKEGNTLEKIAKRFDVSVTTLNKARKIWENKN